MKEIKALIKQHGLERNIQITGLVDVPKFLNSVHVLVYPLQTITGVIDISPTTLEGLAAGCAVISTRMGSIPEIIEHNKNGILISEGAHNDPEAYAEAIMDLIQDPVKLKKIRAIGKKNLQEYDLERSFPEMLRVYNEVAHSKPNPATFQKNHHENSPNLENVIDQTSGKS